MIKFHYTFLLMAISYVLVGYYINLIAITSLIVVHELGHYIMGYLFDFNPTKIIIYPFGGITKMGGLINKDINREIIVACMGVIFQYLFFLFILFLNREGLVRDYTLNIFREYNKEIIFFNLLPIYPLDGFKIINLLLSKIFSYNLSNKIGLVFSLFFMVIFFVFNGYNHNYSYFMIISVLLFYNYKYIGNIKYIYNKFLLERYLYDIDYGNIKFINNYRKMYKNSNHIFRIGNKYIEEKKYLRKYYFK